MKGKWDQEALKVAIQWGTIQGNMRDSAMAYELQLSRERIRQIRESLSIDPYKPPLKELKLKSKPCIRNCDRKVYKKDNDTCSKCRAGERFRLDPQYRKKQNEWIMKRKKRLLSDPSTAHIIRDVEHRANKKYREKMKEKMKETVRQA